MSRIDLMQTWLSSIQPDLAGFVYPRAVSGVAAAFDAKTQQSSFEFDEPPAVLFISDKTTLLPAANYNSLPDLKLTTEEQEAIARTIAIQTEAEERAQIKAEFEKKEYTPRFYNGDHIIITAAIYDHSDNTLYLEARKVDYAFLLTLRNKAFPATSTLYQRNFFQTGVLCPLITEDDSLVLMQRSQLGLFSQAGGFLEPINGMINFPDSNLVTEIAQRELEEELLLNAKTQAQRFHAEKPTISSVSFRKTDGRLVNTMEFIAPARARLKADRLQYEIKHNSAKDSKEHTGVSALAPLSPEKRNLLLAIALVGVSVLPGQPLFLPMLLTACRLISDNRYLPRSVPNHSTFALPISALFPKPRYFAPADMSKIGLIEQKEEPTRKQEPDGHSTCLENAATVATPRI